MPEADRKEVRLAWGIVALLLSVIGGMGTLWYVDWNARFSRIESSLAAAIADIDNKRRTDMEALSHRLDEHAASLRQVREEQMARTTRIAEVEAIAQRNKEWIDRNTERIVRLAEDVATIRARLLPRDDQKRQQPESHR